MQAKVVDGIGASRQGSPPLVTCAVTRDQLHHQGAGPWAGRHARRSAGATAIKENPVRGMRVRLVTSPAYRSIGSSTEGQCRWA